MTMVRDGANGETRLSAKSDARPRIAHRGAAVRERVAVGLLRAAVRDQRYLHGRRAALYRLVPDPRARSGQGLDRLSRRGDSRPARAVRPVAAQPPDAPPTNHRAPPATTHAP